MYDEFLTLARADAQLGETYGIQCFFRMCSYGLEGRWDPLVWDDFQSEVLNDLGRGSLYGLEKLKAFLVCQKFDFPIPVDAQVQAALRPYPTLESFKDRPRQRGRGRAKGPTRRNQADDARRRRGSPASAPCAESPIRRWHRR
jgi:hypothetical protein